MIQIFKYGLLLVLIYSCNSGMLTQEELETKFNNEWCSCLEKHAANSSPEDIVLSHSVSCVQLILSDYLQNDIMIENFHKLIKKRNYDPTLSDYEKERLFGKELGKKLLQHAVDHCIVYRRAINPVKKFYFEQIKKEFNIQTQTDLESLKDSMQFFLGTFTREDFQHPKLRSFATDHYVLLGILSEFSDAQSDAIVAYDKALEIDSSHSTANAFKKMITTYKNE